MTRLMVAALALACAGLAGSAQAESKKANPTGTWKWTTERNGEKTERVLKLKLEKGKLTGQFVRPDGNETAIEDGKYKDGELSFTLNFEANGQKFTVKYSGKVSGDEIKGKTEFERNGETRSRDWEAKRSKD